MRRGEAPPKYPSRTRQTVWPYCEMWLVGSSAAPSLQQKTRIARSTEMRAMPDVFAFLTAASIAREGIFSCCRIGEQTSRTSSTKEPAKGVRPSRATQRHPTEHRVAARTSQDVPAPWLLSSPYFGIGQDSNPADSSSSSGLIVAIWPATDSSSKARCSCSHRFWT